MQRWDTEIQIRRKKRFFKPRVVQRTEDVTAAESCKKKNFTNRSFLVPVRARSPVPSVVQKKNFTIWYPVRASPVPGVVQKKNFHHAGTGLARTGTNAGTPREPLKRLPRNRGVTAQASGNYGRAHVQFNTANSVCVIVVLSPPCSQFL